VSAKGEPVRAGSLFFFFFFHQVPEFSSVLTAMCQAEASAREQRPDDSKQEKIKKTAQHLLPYLRTCRGFGTVWICVCGSARCHGCVPARPKVPHLIRLPCVFGAFSFAAWSGPGRRGRRWLDGGGRGGWGAKGGVGGGASVGEPGLVAVALDGGGGGAKGVGRARSRREGGGGWGRCSGVGGWLEGGGGGGGKGGWGGGGEEGR